VQQVAAASREQASGVSQINNAMTQVDKVTQRNASAAEELASTAEEMSSQSESLQQMVAAFTITDSERPAARPARHSVPPSVMKGRTSVRAVSSHPIATAVGGQPHVV
jgi:methyl-accepting chemotaxis protein